MRRPHGLRSKQLDGPFGVRYTSDGDRMPWGNPVIGIRNPDRTAAGDQRDARRRRVHRLPPRRRLRRPARPRARGSHRDGARPRARRSGQRCRKPAVHRHHHPALPADHAARATCTPRPGSSGPRASRPTPSATSPTTRASPSRPKACSSSRGGLAAERYWRAIARLNRSSGVIRWSWLSSPMSSCTHSISPVKRLPVGP